MDSFDELNLSAALVEALAAEGIERPTTLQGTAIPVLLRGNNLVARAGPGAGVTVAVGAPLLDRLEPAQGGPVGVIVTPTPERARHMATELGRLALATAHRVAALESGWALPEQASLLVATPEALGLALRESRIDLSGVQALVVDGAATLATLDEAWRTVENLFEVVADEAQRVVVSLPVPDRVRELAEARMRRAVTVPPGEGTEGVASRGSVRARTVTAGGTGEALARLAAELLTDDVRHLMVFAGTEDAAADLADHLTLRGFPAGAPGDADHPIWVGVDALEARPALDEQEAGTVVVVSADAPADPDVLDRRHGGGRGGWVLAHADELPHLRDVGRRTGYRVETGSDDAAAAPSRTGSALSRLLHAVETGLEHADVDAYQVVLAPLFDAHGPERVAGALLGVLRTRPELLDAIARTSAPAPQAGGARSPAPQAAGPATDMVRLFVSLGERDGARPGDLVGAITGEARIDGNLIGRIDIRDTFSRVEVAREVADTVIKALNGTTVRGRAVRVDLDRSERSGGGRPPRGGGGPPRGSGGRPGRGGARKRPG